MAKKQEAKTEVKHVAMRGKVVEVNGEQVLMFKARKPLSARVFELTAEMLRKEQEATGIKCLLIPFSAEVEMEPAPEPEPEK